MSSLPPTKRLPRTTRRPQPSRRFRSLPTDRPPLRSPLRAGGARPSSLAIIGCGVALAGIAA
ncbi:MAG: hypothetical protein ACYTGR_11860, partial [Planctomycetota bacterium]